MDTMAKLEILADAAKYDVACTSSGVDRRGKKGQLGAASAAGCCHAFTADGRCVTLLKVLLTNVCCYDCAYCVNRRSNDIPRAAFTPRELATLTVEFYRRNYIEGLFVSSGVIKNPDYTMELIIETARILREDEGFRGYIYAKAIQGASPELLERLGFLVDRMSINIELPSQSSLDLLAPEKSGQAVVRPMRQLCEGIEQSKQDRKLARRRHLSASVKSFVPAGQSTQMIIGATPETDQHILKLAESLYQSVSLKRVFFSAYLPVNDDSRLPELNTEVHARAPAVPGRLAAALLRLFRRRAAQPRASRPRLARRPQGELGAAAYGLVPARREHRLSRGAHARAGHRRAGCPAHRPCAQMRASRL